MNSILGIPVVDAHSHYFSSNTLKAWQQRGRTLENFSKRLSTRTNMTKIELPEEEVDIAKKWINELNRYGVQAMGVMVGKEAYDDFLIAKKRFPGRFLGYANINPGEKDSVDKVAQAASDGFYGIKLYPSSWKGIKVYDKICYPIYKEALNHNLLIFLHFGVTIGGRADLRNGNPIDIQVPSRDFPDLKFIIAHFGAGWFREVLLLQYQTDNVYMDSSGSNTWMNYLPYDLNLKKIFKRAIIASGAKRILFGTDSTFFPRGWRIKVLEDQVGACRKLLSEPEQIITEEEMKKIFAGNILDITGFKPAASK